MMLERTSKSVTLGMPISCLACWTCQTQLASPSACPACQTRRAKTGNESSFWREIWDLSLARSLLGCDGMNPFFPLHWIYPAVLWLFQRRSVFHTWSFSEMASVRLSSRLIAEIQWDLLYSDNSLASFPWFSIIEGTFAKYNPLSHPLLFLQPTIKHRTIFLRRMQLICLHIYTQIWRCSNCCQGFGHVSEHDLYTCQPLSHSVATVISNKLIPWQVWFTTIWASYPSFG